MGCGAGKHFDAAKAGVAGNLPGKPTMPSMPDIPDPEVLALLLQAEGMLNLPAWKTMTGRGFDGQDKDKSGQIDSKELETTMGVLQKGVVSDLFPGADTSAVDKAAVTAALKKYNKDKDANLNKDEFHNFSTEYIKQTIGNTAKTYKKSGKSLDPVRTKLTERTAQLSTMK